MHSPEWRHKRGERMRLDNNRCCMCGTYNDLEVHHLHYRNLGREDIIKDLVTVCVDCHKKIHALYDRQYR